MACTVYSWNVDSVMVDVSMLYIIAGWSRAGGLSGTSAIKRLLRLKRYVRSSNALIESFGLVSHKDTPVTSAG